MKKENLELLLQYPEEDVKVLKIQDGKELKSEQEA